METIHHSQEELGGFTRIIDQLDFRTALVMQTLKDHGYTRDRFDAVCSRGGLLRHVPSGTYRINDAVIFDIYNPPYGEHASSLGPVIAKTPCGPRGRPCFFG